MLIIVPGTTAYRNEAELGKAIKKAGVPRSSLFVTTKLKNVKGKDVQAGFAASLQKLDLDYVDLYLVHSPFMADSPEHLQQIWAEMEKIKESGRAKSIGVSNFLQEHLETILKTAKIPPAVNQSKPSPVLDSLAPPPNPNPRRLTRTHARAPAVEYHPYLQHHGLVPFCQSQHIAVAAYAPLAAVAKAPRPGPADPLYAELARKYGVTEGDVALRWAIDQGVVAVTTSASEQRLRSYVARLPGFKLTPREVGRLAEAGRRAHFRTCWVERFAADDTR